MVGLARGQAAPAMGRVPAAQRRLPIAHADDPQAALSLAVMRLRSQSPWCATTAPALLCKTKPPFGILDKVERIRGAIWMSGDRTNRTDDSEDAAQRECLELGRVLNRVTATPSRRAFGTCAVVGSSGGLRGSGHGAQIDAHDAVFRFNTAPVGDRFAADVGNRTNFWVASHAPWRSQIKTRVGAVAGEEAALYCFNPWLGSCFGDAVAGKRADARGRPVAPLLVSPALTSAVMGLQVTC